MTWTLTLKLTNKQWKTTKVRAGQSRNDEWGQEPQGLLRRAARNLEREDENQRPPPAGWHNRRRGGRRKNLRNMRGIHPNNLRDWSIGEHRHATALGVLYPIHRLQDDPRVRVRKKLQIPANWSNGGRVDDNKAGFYISRRPPPYGFD